MEEDSEIEALDRGWIKFESNLQLIFLFLWLDFIHFHVQISLD